MKNKINDLRDHLFATIEDLRDKDKPMDLDRAVAIAKVADRIIESAKVEVKAMELIGVVDSEFLGHRQGALPPPGKQAALPGNKG